MKLGHPGSLFRAPEFTVERNGNWKSIAQEWGHDAVNTVRVWNTNNPLGRKGDSARFIDQPNPLAQRFSHDYWEEKYTNAARSAYLRARSYAYRNEDEKAAIEANWEQEKQELPFPNKITFPANHHSLVHSSHFPHEWYSGFKGVAYFVGAILTYAGTTKYPILWIPTILMAWSSMRIISDGIIHGSEPSTKSYDWMKSQPWSAYEGKRIIERRNE